VNFNEIVEHRDAARKLDTGPVLAPALSPRSSGRSGGSITACHAVNMDGAALSALLHDSEVSRPI
jgi:hypothetical protein